MVDRGFPWLRLCLVIGDDERPDFDGALALAAVGNMPPVARRTHAVESGARIRIMREDGVHRFENLAQRAEGDAEVHLAERLLRAFGTGPHLVEHAFEHHGIGTLEGIDRLLPVTHHEQGAGLAAVAAFAGKELGCQRLHDLPLHRAGVLRLVDQQVLDAAIELEQHPGGVRPVLQELRRLDDEVVEIIGTARPFGCLETTQDGAAEPQQRQRGAKAFEITQGTYRREEARLIGLHEGLDPAMLLAGCRRGHVGAELRFAGEQDGAQRIKVHIVTGEGPPDFSGHLRVVLAAAVERLRQLAVARHVAGEARHETVARHVGCQRQALAQQLLGPLQATLLEQLAQVGAPRQKLGEEAVEGISADAVGHVLQRLPHRCVLVLCGGEHVVARLLQQLQRLPVVQHGEVGNDPRFHRKQLQHALAKGVDGLDLQPTRRFERASEQLARAFEQGAIGIGRTELLQLGLKGVIIENDPLAQAFEQAVGHFRGRRLGEGQAHDARGLGAAEHQPHHAVDQHMGFSRAGIGIDPHGG